MNYTLKDKLGTFVFMQHFCLYLSHMIGILKLNLYEGVFVFH
jgi:hypothetical protein